MSLQMSSTIEIKETTRFTSELHLRFIAHLNGIMDPTFDDPPEDVLRERYKGDIDRYVREMVPFLKNRPDVRFEIHPEDILPDQAA